MARHRTQLYLDDDQYRWLKRRAGRRSMASVVRDLIDEARTSGSKRDDPFFRWLLEEPAPSGARRGADTIDEDVYGDGSPCRDA